MAEHEFVTGGECKETMTRSFAEVYRQLNNLKKDVADYREITMALTKQIEIMKDRPIRIDKY